MQKKKIVKVQFNCSHVCYAITFVAYLWAIQLFVYMCYEYNYNFIHVTTWGMALLTFILHVHPDFPPGGEQTQVPHLTNAASRGKASYKPFIASCQKPGKCFSYVTVFVSSFNTHLGLITNP